LILNPADRVIDFVPENVHFNITLPPLKSLKGSFEKLVAMKIEKTTLELTASDNVKKLHSFRVEKII